MSDDEKSLPRQVELLKPKPRKDVPFLPWHTPVKQYIREHQWGPATSKLIDDMNIEKLNYMTLPGPDLFDIIATGSICKSKDIPLRYLGFERSKDELERFRQAIEKFDVNGSGLKIDSSSNIINHALERIAEENSPARREFIDRGAFDVVNFDACGSLANQDAYTSNSRLIDALKSVIQIQTGQCGRDWLLYLTANFSSQNFTQGTFSSLMNSILMNASESSQFKQASLICIGCNPTDNLENEITDIPAQGSLNFIRQCTLGLGKWIMHMLDDNQWTVEMGDAYVYSTGPEVDMLSAVIKFKKEMPILMDNSGLTNNSPPKSRPTVSTDVHLANQISQMEDLDVILEANPDNLTKLILEKAELLHSRGYDTGGARHSKYKGWLKSLASSQPQ